MKLTPAQSTIAKDTHRFRVIDAGRRFGKSTLISWEMFAIAISQDDARVPYYAPTRDDARDIMWGMLKKVSEPLIVEVNEGRLEITVRNRHKGTSRMLLYGWEAVQERGKGVGVKNNHIFLDEVSKYKNFWMGWQEILRPTLTDLAGGATFISTPNGFNHFYDLYGMEGRDPDYKSFHFTSYDNPYLPVEEINKAKNELPEDRFAQEYLADFRKQSGLVYKEFSRDRHIVDSEPETVVATLGGVDFGFTNPTAALKIRKDYAGVYWIMSEWYKTGRTEDEVVDHVVSQSFNVVYPDPENASAIESLRRKSVNVREVSKGKGSIVSGVSKVREMLKQGRIKVHRSCINTIQEFEQYAYPEGSGKETESELPDPQFNHAMDALRYVIMTDIDLSVSTAPVISHSSQPIRRSNQIKIHKYLGNQ